MGLISVPPNLLPLIGTMAWMAMRDINLNTSTVLTFSIAIGLAVDDTIHMLARFREEYGRGHDVSESIRLSGRGSGRAVVITSVMLVSGLMVMLNSSFVPIKLFSELLTVTIAMCLVGDLLLLPALLKLFWPEHSKRTP
jgi:predicted RND superfamily exporter protein